MAAAAPPGKQSVQALESCNTEVPAAWGTRLVRGATTGGCTHLGGHTGLRNKDGTGKPGRDTQGYDGLASRPLRPQPWPPARCRTTTASHARPATCC